MAKNSDVYFGFAEQEKNASSDAGASSSSVLTPVTTVKVDECTGVKTETTALNTAVNLPDEANVGVAKQIVEDCLKCYDRSETSLANLTRIYKSQTQQTSKLKVTLQKAKRKERRQKKTCDTLQDALKAVAEMLPKVAEGLRRQQTPTAEAPPMDVGQLQNLIGEIRDAVDDLRRESNEITDLYNELTAKKAMAEKTKAAEDLDAATNKLAALVDEKNNELAELWETLNAALATVGGRLGKNYKVESGAESPGDAKPVLTTLGIDVRALFHDRERAKGDVECLKTKIERTKALIKGTEEAHAKLVEEIVRLLQICGKSADRPNPENYPEVQKFVEEVFNNLLVSIQARFEDVSKIRCQLRDAQREEERKQAEFEREMALKAEKLKLLRAETEELECKNKALREEADRLAKSPEATKPDTLVAERLQEKLQGQKCREKERAKDLEEKLAKSKERSETARKKLKQLTCENNEIDEKLDKKRRELEELKIKVAGERENGKDKTSQLENEITKLQDEVEALERELQNELKKSNTSEHLQKCLAQMMEYEKRLKEQIAKLDQKIAEYENARDKVKGQLKGSEDKCGDLAKTLTEEEAKRQELEKELAAIQDDIDVANKALDRERLRNLDKMAADAVANQLKLHQSVCSSITTGPGSRLYQSAESKADQ